MIAPDVNELVEAIRAALAPQRLPASEGWQTLKEIMEATDASEPKVRRRIRGMGPKIERQLCGGYMFYRLTQNGNSPPKPGK